LGSIVESKRPFKKNEQGGSRGETIRLPTLWILGQSFVPNKRSIFSMGSEGERIMPGGHKRRWTRSAEAPNTAGGEPRDQPEKRERKRKWGIDLYPRHRAFLRRGRLTAAGEKWNMKKRSGKKSGG